MLVRVFRCEHENIKYPFGEKECRVMRGLENKEWDEFLVVWKNQRIELYENYVSSILLCSILFSILLKNEIRI